MLIHATVIAIKGKAIALCGESGMGKSDLALRLLDRGASLVGDDYVELSLQDEKVMATSPASIEGKMEVRGLGIIKVDSLVKEAELCLSIELVSIKDEPRMPDEDFEVYFDQKIPKLTLHSFHHTSPIKVELALTNLCKMEPAP